MKSEPVLVDTTVWVKFLRGLDASLRDRISPLIMEEKACTTEIVISEILKGARSDREYMSLRKDFLALSLLSVTQSVWEVAWNLGYRLRKRGVNVPLTDVLIAAVAIHYRCRLMHSDKHFDLISQNSSLKVLEA